jgi:hypothetical protein
MAFWNIEALPWMVPASGFIFLAFLFLNSPPQIDFEVTATLLARNFPPHTYITTTAAAQKR